MLRIHHRGFYDVHVAKEKGGPQEFANLKQPEECVTNLPNSSFTCIYSRHINAK